MRKKIGDDMRATSNYIKSGGGTVLVRNIPGGALPQFERKRLDEIARAMNTDPAEAALRLFEASISSPIGEWEAEVSFQGEGKALIRPDAFHVAKAGEESDLIFGIEEATSQVGRIKTLANTLPQDRLCPMKLVQRSA